MSQVGTALAYSGFVRFGFLGDCKVIKNALIAVYILVVLAISVIARANEVNNDTQSLLVSSELN